PPDPHSLPTRRSSDLVRRPPVVERRQVGDAAARLGDQEVAFIGVAARVVPGRVTGSTRSTLFATARAIACFSSDRMTNRGGGWRDRKSTGLKSSHQIT